VLSHTEIRLQAEIKHVVVLHCRNVYRVCDDVDEVGGMLPLVVWEIRRYNFTEEYAATKNYPEDGDIMLLRNAGASLLKN
jgi:hypothetical protein